MIGKNLSPMCKYYPLLWLPIYGFLYLILFMVNVSNLITQYNYCQQAVTYKNLAKQSCWLLNQNMDSMDLLDKCTGITVVWLTDQINQWTTRHGHTVQYKLILTDEFYQWAYQNALFDKLINISSVSDIRNLCRAETCSIYQPDKKCCLWYSGIQVDMGTDSDVPGLCYLDELTSDVPVCTGLISEFTWMSYVNRFNVTSTYRIFVRILIGRLQVILYQPVEPTSAEDEPGSLNAVEIFLIAVAVVILILCVPLAIYLFRTESKLRVIEETSWRIDPSNIKNLDPFQNNEEKLSTLNLSRPVTNTIAIVNDTLVAVKQIRVNILVITDQMKAEIMQVKSMNHNNLVKLIGLTIQSGVVTTYTEYCHKESLRSIIRREAIPLSWCLRLVLLADIARGMLYLHEKQIIHGKLHSNNCVVDDHWTCKITDYGLDSLRYEDEVSRVKSLLEKDEYVPFLAPEYRRMPELRLVPEMDAYSYGTILYEMATRKKPHRDPWFLEDPEQNNPSLVEQSYFENLEKYEVGTAPNPDGYNQLMSSCWELTPIRPNFHYIKKRIKELNPRKLGALEVTLVMMKEYSDRLESLVEERTKLLNMEKQLADNLLNSMLPKQVVAQLRVGEHVPPEAFSECTIYFSDIVGFTTISSKSTPFEVVGLLNKLYSQFDEIIDRYDVYKVETIGDAYMVASGVPRRNGERHAIAITDMSLDLVDVSHTFVIPHMPQEPLKIRVGLHSGPVCAGVVGLKMPRYCLFGDTVNTASRMESTGEAYKIHCSDTTHSILERLGGFTFERRGTITVKGKGEMQTWWVLGRTRAELAKDCCPLPLNWKKKLKKKMDDTLKSEAEASTEVAEPSTDATQPPLPSVPETPESTSQKVDEPSGGVGNQTAG